MILDAQTTIQNIKPEDQEHARHLIKNEINKIEKKEVITCNHIMEIKTIENLKTKIRENEAALKKVDKCNIIVLTNKYSYIEKTAINVRN